MIWYSKARGNIEVSESRPSVIFSASKFDILLKCICLCVCMCTWVGCEFQHTRRGQSITCWSQFTTFTV